MTHNANIVEIFSSIQGEGLYVGETMTFVRFGGCSLRCKICDTPQALEKSDVCRIETPPGSMEFNEIDNPVGVARLCEILSAFDNNTISLTGGEPLEQADFLTEWLPSQVQGKRILLETNGIHHENLDIILPYVHVISMDMKLPSSFGCRAFWNEHVAFLKKVITSGKELYVKLVIAANTVNKDIQNAIDILTRTNKFIPVVIQPAATTLKFYGHLSDERLLSVERLCTAFLPDVRIVPQMHKEWGIL